MCNRETDGKKEATPKKEWNKLVDWPFYQSKIGFKICKVRKEGLYMDLNLISRGWRW